MVENFSLPTFLIFSFVVVISCILVVAFCFLSTWILLPLLTSNFSSIYLVALPLALHMNAAFSNITLFSNFSYIQCNLMETVFQQFTMETSKFTYLSLCSHSWNRLLSDRLWAHAFIPLFLGEVKVFKNLHNFMSVITMNGAPWISYTAVTNQSNCWFHCFEVADISFVTSCFDMKIPITQFFLSDVIENRLLFIHFH